MAKLAVPQITPLISLKRFPQISESHCGPAVLQMLLNYQGVSVSQQEITKSSKVTRTIKEKGIRPDQLSNAVRKLAPGFKMYYKDHGSLRDVASIINDYHLPVAVEWQGLFGLKIDPKSYKPVEINDGHYSIIIKTDNTSKEVTLLDPYKDFIDEDRVFTFDQFNKRWWD
ncbi:MAG TPA: cysteine peptidase family C39 domain-containing protein, partial [Patescibacteria group bacterium]